MARDEELWILLTDPHDRREVGGLWTEGIVRLAGSSSPAPWVLTEPRIAACVEKVAPDARVRLSAPEGPVRRIEEIKPDHAALLDLLFLHGRIPNPSRWTMVRSFGLRASVLGGVVAAEFGRPHVAFLCGSIGRSNGSLKGYQRHRAIQYLEGWVIATATRIETPDEGSAVRLQELYLPPPGRIMPALLPPSVSRKPAARDDCFSVAVVASTACWRANQVLLNALARLEIGERLRIHWLARRQGFTAMRARQYLRRRNLSQHLCWEEEPWDRPIHLRKESWDLLFLPAPRPSARILASVFAASSGTVVVPEGGERLIGLPAALSIPWAEAPILDLLKSHANQTETCSRERR